MERKSNAVFFSLFFEMRNYREYGTGSTVQGVGYREVGTGRLVHGAWSGNSLCGKYAVLGLRFSNFEFRFSVFPVSSFNRVCFGFRFSNRFQCGFNYGGQYITVWRPVDCSVVANRVLNVVFRFSVWRCGVGYTRSRVHRE